MLSYLLIDFLSDISPQRESLAPWLGAHKKRLSLIRKSGDSANMTAAHFSTATPLGNVNT